MRLWLPQLFTTFQEYEDVSVMCFILEYIVNKTGLVKETKDTCEVIITPSSYVNNIIEDIVGCVGYFLVGFLINKVGNKHIQVGGLIIAATCGGGTSAVGTSVVLLPTSLRTMIISVGLMFGRIGSIMGNILFPVFMSFGFISPFAIVGGVMFVDSAISGILPNTRKSDLK